MEATKKQREDISQKWKRDSDSLEDMQNKYNLAQKELNDRQQLPGSNALEIQQNWEADSAFASGVSSPAFSVSSQLDNHVVKQQSVEELQYKNQELQENINTLIAELTEEKDKSKDLIGELNKTNQDLIKTQNCLGSSMPEKGIGEISTEIYNWTTTMV